ncbi:MAG: hypothetical protein RDU30_11025 [Desulfovibrionaceae bacterium]|nr:hypothetical protein [Desulfovibrionaceae bacterium]
MYIIANTHPVEFGGMIKAPGFRAFQYFCQSKTHFAKTKYVLFVERYNLYNNKMGIYQQYKANSNVIILARDNFETFVERIEDSSFVFTQADFVAEAYLAKEKNDVYYDILAPKLLELTVGGFNPAQIKKYEVYHDHMLHLAKEVFVNGEKTLDWIRSDSQNTDIGKLNKFTPTQPFSMQTRKNREFIFFGGTTHNWINNTHFLRTMYAYLKKEPDQKAFFLTNPVNLQTPANREISQLSLLHNVHFITNVTLHNYLDILGMSFGFLDLSDHTLEREYSTSTRVLQSIYAGVPALHQTNTGLDSFWPEFPGLLVDADAFHADHVHEFVQNAKKKNYSGALEQARIIKDEILNTDIFC